METHSFSEDRWHLCQYVNSHLASGLKNTGQKESTWPWERQEKEEPELQ